MRILQILVKSGKALKKQAKNNDAQMFETSIFPKEFDKVAQKCYMEQMDAFSKLFEDEQFYKRVMSEMAKAMYLNYRNSALGEERKKSPVISVSNTPVDYSQDEESNYLMAAEEEGEFNSEKAKDE
jgi:type I restriction enzyme R subunit